MILGPDLSQSLDTVLESVFIEVKPDKKYIYINWMYSSPSHGDLY